MLLPLPPDVVQAARERDREAQDELGIWLRHLLMPYFKRYFSHWHSEDLLQETSVDVFKKLADEAPDDPTEFRDWVYGFAWNEVRDFLRKSRLRGKQGVLLYGREPEPPKGPEPGPETILRNKEINAIAWRCMERLPDIYRDAVLHVVDGGSYRTLAVAAQISEGAARKRIHDARKQLRTLVRKARQTRPELQHSPLV
jgi:RNA polymerase sigma-70 factor (ECF subfamily)